MGNVQNLYFFTEQEKTSESWLSGKTLENNKIQLANGEIFELEGTIMPNLEVSAGLINGKIIVLEVQNQKQETQHGNFLGVFIAILILVLVFGIIRKIYLKANK